MRDLARPLPFRAAFRAVFGLALDAMVWTRRSLLLGLLLGLPVLLAAAYRILIATRGGSLPLAPADLHALVVSIYWIRNALPLVALFYATSLIADEVEGRTLGYLLTRPLTRAAILSGKFAAYLATTLTQALPACVLTFALLHSAPGSAGLAAASSDLLRDLGVITLTLMAYGSLFALLGVLLKRPVIPGLMFLYGWELLANLPGYLPRFTLTAWLRSLVPYRPAQEGLLGLFEQVLPAGQAVAVLVVVTAAFLFAAVRTFSVKEYVLEQ
jgi:ABC-type transport system involved in multi-copper enzyme maturation permease subunit